MQLKNKKIKDFAEGELFQGFYLIKSIESKTDTNNKPFLDLIITDDTGDINAKKWDYNSSEDSLYGNNDLVKIQGRTKKWKEKLQVSIEKIRLATENDKVEVSDFIRSAPLSEEIMKLKLDEFVNKISNNQIKGIIEEILAEHGKKFIYYPAAMTNHHAYRGGLLHHTLTMLEAGEKMAEIYTFVDRDLLYAGIILHDFAKIFELDAGKYGIASGYTVAGELLGHLIQGVSLIENAAVKVGASEEIKLLLQHTLISHHNEPEYGSPKRPMIPEAELLHHLDNLDARMNEMQEALSEINQGELTGRIWAMENRKLYKKTEK